MTDRIITDPCEYNPSADRPAYSNEVHAVAEWVVGANGQWRLCDSCAALPKFKRFTHRLPIRRETDDTSDYQESLRRLPEAAAILRKASAESRLRESP